MGKGETIAPEYERGRGRAEWACPVARRGTADAAALQDGDRLVARLASGTLLVQAWVGVAFPLPKIAAALQRSFLDQHDVETRLRHQLGRDACACTGANDDDIAAQRLRQRCMRP